jgi:hypothetical protein
MSESSNNMSEPSSGSISNNSKEVQAHTNKSKIPPWDIISKWFQRATKITGLFGAWLVFSYFLMTGYTPIDNLAGVGAIAVFIAYIAVLLAFSFTVLWGMPSFVLNQWVEAKNRDDLVGGLLQGNGTATSPVPSLQKVLLFSAGTIIAPGLIFWLRAFKPFLGEVFYILLVAGAIVFALAWYAFVFPKGSSDSPRLLKNKENRARARKRTALFLVLSATSLPAALPIIKILENASVLEKASDQAQLAAVFGSLVIVCIGNSLAWAISLSPKATDTVKHVATAFTAASSIALLALLVGATSGLTRMVMSASSMRLDNTTIHIEGSFCGVLARVVEPKEASPTRCMVTHAQVSSRLGDRWWVECRPRSKNATSDSKPGGYSLPASQVITWTRGIAAESAASAPSAPQDANAYAEYTASQVCDALIKR